MQFGLAAPQGGGLFFSGQAWQLQMDVMEWRWLEVVVGKAAAGVDQLDHGFAFPFSQHQLGHGRKIVGDFRQPAQIEQYVFEHVQRVLPALAVIESADFPGNVNGPALAPGVGDNAGNIGDLSVIAALRRAEGMLRDQAQIRCHCIRKPSDRSQRRYKALRRRRGSGPHPGPLPETRRTCSPFCVS